jgi:hypothetical protein
MPATPAVVLAVAEKSEKLTVSSASTAGIGIETNGTIRLC